MKKELIGAAAVIIAALIGGIFLLVSKGGNGTSPISTPTSMPTSVISTQQSIYNQALSGSPVLSDSLTSQDNWSWAASDNPGSNCAFTGNTYHAIAQETNFVSWCLAQATNLSNFAFQVQMTIVQGNAGGLVFSANGSGMYRFVVDQNGTYNLIAADANNHIERLISAQTSSAIKTGLNQPNTLTVLRNGDQIYLYINGQYVNETTDSTYSSGQIGFLAWDYEQPTDVVYTNAKVWKL